MATSLDVGYVKSCYGVLKIIEFLCLMVAWICLLDSTSIWVRGSRESFFLAVTISGWIFVIIWFCFYLFMLCGKLTFGSQGLIFGIIHLIWAGLLIVAGALVADKAVGFRKWFCSFSRHCRMYEAAAAFCLISGVLFLIDGIYHLYQHQNGVMRIHGGTTSGGGTRTVTTTKTVVKTTKTTR